jgi:putative ABC transport system substrate-binding protein
VPSLARPGNNVTGFRISTGAELDGKRLELLREALPSLARVAVVWNPRNDANPHKLASLEAPARALGVQLERPGPRRPGHRARARRRRAATCLMSYGPSVAENFRRAAGYVDRILKGAKPADLPIEQPATLELMINLKAARVLGLTIPQSLLVRAAHIIE